MTDVMCALKGSTVKNFIVNDGYRPVKMIGILEEITPLELRWKVIKAILETNEIMDFDENPCKLDVLSIRLSAFLSNFVDGRT